MKTKLCLFKKSIELSFTPLSQNTNEVEFSNRTAAKFPVTSVMKCHWIQLKMYKHHSSLTIKLLKFAFHLHVIDDRTLIIRLNNCYEHHSELMHEKYSEE